MISTISQEVSRRIHPRKRGSPCDSRIFDPSRKSVAGRYIDIDVLSLAFITGAMPPLEMDPDEAVQSTNDDAQASKASCVQAGYFEDKFIRYFVNKKGARPRTPVGRLRLAALALIGVRSNCPVASTCPQSCSAQAGGSELELGASRQLKQTDRIERRAVRKAPLINRGYYTRHAAACPR